MVSLGESKWRFNSMWAWTRWRVKDLKELLIVGFNFSDTFCFSIVNATLNHVSNVKF